MRYMNIKEFADDGYLQELNRQFLHPLGLALYVNEREDGQCELGGIADYRDDPEGVIFDQDYLEDPANRCLQKAQIVSTQRQKVAKGRHMLLSYYMQALPEPSEGDKE